VLVSFFVFCVLLACCVLTWRIEQEGGIRHNIKKRWTVVDESGITYFASNSAKDMAKPLGFVDAKTILSTCELGVKKKQDFCIEVATAGLFGSLYWS
jgi:hypothetical protein